MKEKPFKFGLLTTSNQLIGQVKNATSAKNIDLRVSFTSMDKALPDAKRMEADGTEVLLVGQITGVILRENLNIPVVCFEITTVDAIKCLMQAAQKGKKILFPMFRKTIHGMDIIEKVIGATIDQFVFSDSNNARDLIHFAKENGYDVVFGGGVIIQYARELNLPHQEFQRSDQIILSTIEFAKSLARASREEKKKTLRYRCIIDAASDGIIAVDEHGRVTTVNSTAKRLLGLEEQNVTGKPIDQFLSIKSITRALDENRPITDNLEKINRTTFVWNHHPFEVDRKVAGCVSTFNKISSVVRAENMIRKSLAKGYLARYMIEDLLYQSDTMQKIVLEAKQYAGTDSNLLITGETGTGKEVLCQSIHNLSKRKKRPFVSINCAALPDQLLESELFGYEEGAFTGTRKGGKPGLFEIAHKGTIFLDEIGETSKQVQIRLLRVLQEREIMRLGGDRLIPINVRVIAATNKDLSNEVAKNRFREDLFFRLNILRIKIPPLREHPEDIPLLTKEFIRYFSKKHSVSSIDVPKHSISHLLAYAWPGNIRQLRNFTERLVLLSNSTFTDKIFDKLYSELVQYRFSKSLQNQHHQQQTPPPKKTIDLKRQLENLKNDNGVQILKQALEETHYSKTKAAKLLGVSRSTLWKRLKKAGLD